MSRKCRVIVILAAAIVLAGCTVGSYFGFVREKEQRDGYTSTTCNITNCGSAIVTCSRQYTRWVGKTPYTEYEYFPCTYVRYVLQYANLTREETFTFTPPNPTYNCTAALGKTASCYVSAGDISKNLERTVAGWVALGAIMAILAGAAALVITAIAIYSFRHRE